MLTQMGRGKGGEGERYIALLAQLCVRKELLEQHDTIPHTDFSIS